MATILRSSFPQSLLPLIGEWLGGDFKSKDSVYDQVFEVFKMDHAFSTDVNTYEAGPMQWVGENEPLTFDTMGQTWNYTYTAQKYMTGFVISEEAMDDTKYLNIAKKKTQSVKRSVTDNRELLAAYVLNNAFNSSVTYGDGVSLVSNAHPIAVGGNQSNRPSSYVDISEAGLEQGKIDISYIRDERGIRIQHKIKGLLVPQELEFQAHRILNSTGRVFTADNDTNALKDLKTIPKTIVWNYLTAPQSWFLLLDKDNGLKYGIRKDMKMNSDNDFQTGAARFKFSVREVAGASDTLRSVYGVQGP